MASRHLPALILLRFLLILLCCERHVAKKYKRPDFCEDPEETDKPMSFLWALKRQPPSYFFGTIHVPYTRVWDFVPDNVKMAFEAADSVFFELDLTQPRTIAALTRCQLLPPGENLADVLPRDIFRRLKRHLEYVKVMLPSWMTADQRGRGLYADYLFNAITGNWERKRPVWVMLMVNSLTESDIKSRGVPVLDLYLAQRAEKEGKRTGAVEKVDEQCVPLNGLNFSQVLFALNQTLCQQESLREGEARVPYSTDDLIKHYSCGDLDAVVFSQDSTQVLKVPTLANGSLAPPDQQTARRIDEYFREELIYKRNQRMGERVMELLGAHPQRSFFFAFGAGHFLGNHTVLDVVSEAGMAVEHVSPDRRLKGHRRKHRHRVVLPKFGLLRDFGPAPNAVEEADAGMEQQLRAQERKAPKSRGGGGASPGGGGGGMSSDTPSKNKHRNFNDLWVRLDPQSHGSRESLSAEARAVQQSLRLWYGLPATTSSGSPPSSSIFVPGYLWLLLISIVVQLPS